MLQPPCKRRQQRLALGVQRGKLGSHLLSVSQQYLIVNGKLQLCFAFAKF
jgi:hypothetical protein